MWCFFCVPCLCFIVHYARDGSCHVMCSSITVAHCSGPSPPPPLLPSPSPSLPPCSPVRVHPLEQAVLWRSSSLTMRICLGEPREWGSSALRPSEEGRRREGGTGREGGGEREGEEWREGVRESRPSLQAVPALRGGEEAEGEDESLHE